MNGVIIVDLKSGTSLFTKSFSKEFEAFNDSNLGSFLFAVHRFAQGVAQQGSGRLKKYEMNDQVLHFSTLERPSLTLLTVLFTQTDFPICLAREIARQIATAFESHFHSAESTRKRNKTFKKLLNAILFDSLVEQVRKLQPSPPWLLLLWTKNLTKYAVECLESKCISKQKSPSTFFKSKTAVQSVVSTPTTLRHEKLQYHSVKFTTELTPEQQTVILDLFLNMIQTMSDQVQEASLRLEGLYEIHFRRFRNCVFIYPAKTAINSQLAKTIDSLAQVCNPTNEHY